MADDKKYKLTGSKNPGEIVDRVLVSGVSTSSDPEDFLEVGGESRVLTDDQVKNLKGMGLLLREDTSSSEDDEEASTTTTTTKVEQQKIQAETTGQPPLADTKKK